MRPGREGPGTDLLCKRIFQFFKSREPRVVRPIDPT